MMNNMGTILLEIYQLLFVASIIFISYVIGDLMIKIYGRFRLSENTHFVLKNKEKIILWISCAILFTYIL